MAEDSGAFKTNSVDTRRISAFCDDPGRPLQRSLTGLRKRFPAYGQTLAPPIFSKRRQAVAVSSNQPDSLHAGDVHCVAKAASQWSTAFPRCSMASLCEGRIRPSMLPGFRFLFAAIVLSISILVFGLGAAALLRAAHEEFASNPSWHAVPEAMVAQQREATRPVLAMLRVEPRPVEPKPSDDVPAVGAEPVAIASPPAEPEQIAAPKPEEAAPAAAAEPDTPVTETPAQSESAAPAPAAADGTQIATSAAAHDTALPPNEAAPAQPSQPAASEQADSPALPTADVVASTTIATLGGPPVVIETPPPANAAGAPDKSEIEKRLRARRAAQRRRAAARARAARLAPQPANPFAQPYGPPLTEARSP
jgi:hypothetical protein